ncbi:leucine-rich repeat domain-containing protein [Candidatus Palauibacter sp.]|uniref:leucine-rich repeat domain-containing protein n=1 Tax=Candidatus Palauibacter sp. TaxID=3101350 RepID=UPI003AF22559
MSKPRWLRNPVICVLAVMACGESAPTQPPRPPPPPPPAPVATSITVSPPTVTLGRGGIRRLTATVRDQQGRPITGATVTWQSNDPATATADAVGRVTGVASGETTISATADAAMATAAVTVEDRLADRVLLTALYEATNRTGWSNRRNWASNRPLSEWSGVEVDADLRVTRLLLGRNGLEGRIPPEIGDLSRLTELHLYDNRLTGPIPPEIGKLSQLRILSLWSNGLTGPIPSEIGDLSVLDVLWLNGNELTGAIPARIGDLAELTVLHIPGNQLTGRIPSEIGNLAKLEELHLSDNALAGPLPRELGRLSALHELGLWGNELTGSIPAELGHLSGLEQLWLSTNDLTGSIPPELGDLSRLRSLTMRSNDLAGAIPPELGGLSDLEELRLNGNDLTGPVPPGLGDLSKLQILLLGANHLTGGIPARLGDLPGLVRLELGDNDLEGPIPSELGQLRSLARLLLHQNHLSGTIPGALGHLTSLQYLSLSHNDLSGPVPAELSGLAALTELLLNANPELRGFLPTSLTDLGSLTTLLADGTALCAPADADFLAWLGTLEDQRVARCRNDVPAAYLVQAVQSREFPVPVVADRPALLRVFLTAPDGESVDFPPVRARLYLGGDEVHAVDIPSPGGTVPAEVDEGTVGASANVEIPAGIVQPGLELVVEVDPDETLGAGSGITRRIPETGRQAIDVRTVPPLDLTYLPVLRPGQEDSGFLERIGAMTEDDTMFWPARLWLPVGEFNLDVRETVFTSAATGSELLREIRAIRVLEGGAGYYMGAMPSYLARELRIGGVAFRPGRSSLARLDSTTVAHELGHNMTLRHAPCGDAPGTDPAFSNRAGNIGAWGFDPSSNSFVPPETADVMSYCRPRWISDFDFGRTLDYRLAEETGAAFAAVAAASPERTLLVWGGVDAAGLPFLDPAFVVHAPPALPRSAGPYTLTGRTAAGEELFSIGFDMQEVADGDGGSGFVFALPVSPAWAARLKAIELSGPGGIATLDDTSRPPAALLRDPRTGRVHGILRDLASGEGHLGTLASVAADPDAIASVLRDAADLEILISRGIPAPEQWRR